MNPSDLIPGAIYRYTGGSADEGWRHQRFLYVRCASNEILGLFQVVDSFRSCDVPWTRGEEVTLRLAYMERIYTNPCANCDQDVGPDVDYLCLACCLSTIKIS